MVGLAMETCIKPAPMGADPSTDVLSMDPLKEARCHATFVVGANTSSQFELLTPVDLFCS